MSRLRQTHSANVLTSIDHTSEPLTTRFFSYSLAYAQAHRRSLRNRSSSRSSSAYTRSGSRPRTSGRRRVKPAPAMQQPKKIQSTFGVPMLFVSELNTSAEMIAPAFPHAADIPCADARNFVGNTSAG